MSHPTADIISESRIFKFMEQRHNDERWYNPQRYYEGCPAHCGFIDACLPRERGPVWDPRKFTRSGKYKIKIHRNIEEEEHEEYMIAWGHSVNQYRVRKLPDLIVFWRIKKREISENWDEIMLREESGTESESESESSRTATTSEDEESEVEDMFDSV